MKIRYFIIVIGLLFNNNSHSQNNVIMQLKQFYESADMDCYIAKIQKNVNEYFVIGNKMWGNDKYGIPPRNIELHKGEVVPMLTIQFVNTDSFNLENDIYDFITIDSSIVFTLACVDKNMNVKAFAHFFDGVNGYFDIDLSLKNFVNYLKLKHVIKNINNQKPELILYNHVLAGFHDNNGFMYVKNGKIYVYRVEEKDVFELNDYIRKFFELERIRRLNYAYIPIIYRNGKSIRRTGNTPDNEKLICHPR